MMTKHKKILVARIGVILVAAPVLIAYLGGPDPGNTAAPGEPAAACAQAGCHVGSNNVTNGSGVEVTFPDGPTYTPGVKQRWTVRVTGAQTPAYGFQLSARLASNERSGQAGDFTVVPNEGAQLICQDGRPKPCRENAPVQFMTHTGSKQSGSWSFEWTPPASDVGNVRVYVAGNAANNNAQNTGDLIFLRNFTLTFKAGAPPISGPPVIRQAQPVLQAFDNSARLSSGSWMQIFGDNLSASTRPWGGGDFNGSQAPTSLDGIRVNVNGKPAFVAFISPNQINAQAPDDTAAGPVEVEVVHSGGVSNKVTVTKTKVSTALLTTPAFNIGGKQYAAALHTDFTTFVGRTGLIAGVPFRPARPGETIILFAVGCGPTNPSSPAGVVNASAAPVASPLQVTFGQTVATAQAFLAAQAVGLCQFNITVPNVTGDETGDIRLDASVDGVATGQTLFTNVQR